MCNLREIRVLIDGYNIKQPYGTGIKTYGLSLIKALKLLKARTGILFDFELSSRFPELNAVILADTTPKRDSYKSSLVFHMIKYIISEPIVSKIPVDFSKILIKKEYWYFEDTEMWNLNKCYDASIKLYKLLKRYLIVKSKDKIDIWHSTYPLPIKIKNARHITTIHDIIPLRLPWATLDDKKLFFNLVKDSIRLSDLILVPSENTKKDLLEFYKIKEEKIVVTYQPVLIEPIHDSEKLERYLRYKFNLNVKGYLLFVGAIEPKKNIRRLLEAYSIVDTDLPLIVVGKKAWLWEGELLPLETNNKLKKRVILLNYVSYKDLRYLYSGAYLFVFPSLYEGFGLPPLEAMRCGCPVITSTTSSLSEVCGNAAIYCDPYSSEDIANKIEYLLYNSDLANKLAKMAKTQSEKYSMENYIDRIYKSYRQII